ncbi:GNAT family N-acetyltransferase [Bacillus sp. AK031]
MSQLILKGQRVYLRSFEDADAENLTKLILRNKTFWGKTEPEWHAEYYTFEGQKQNIRYFHSGLQKGTFYTLGIFAKETHTLIGIINLYEVKSGPFQSASVGYSVDRNQTGKGICTESLNLVLAFAFQQLNLNRVAAEVMPGNYPSVRVLEKAGFQKEGFARENLLINGTWENHLQYSLLKKEWK